MAQWGISLFLGTPEVAERLPGYLAEVAGLGGTEVFTSLHIPEVPLESAVAQLEGLTAAAQKLGMATIADIAPRALQQLGATPENLEPLAQMGLAGVRLDYGFGPWEIARFAQNSLGLRVVLNVSTVDPAFLQQIISAGADPRLLEGCHNYYPRPETGLSMAHFVNTSRAFKQHKLRVSAFVAGQSGRRGPLFEGLPTLERHRAMPAGRAAAELFATGLVDTVLFGDPWATSPELSSVSAVAATGGVRLRVRLAPNLSAFERGILEGPLHENRPDAAECVVRSTASRAYATKGPKIEPFNTVARPVGSVTIDNQGYLRYSGELQVTITDLPADPRVNVVGQVIEEDLDLLQWIGPGQSFKLVPVEGDA